MSHHYVTLLVRATLLRVLIFNMFNQFISDMLLSINHHITLVKGLCHCPILAVQTPKSTTIDHECLIMSGKLEVRLSGAMQGFGKVAVWVTVNYSKMRPISFFPFFKKLGRGSTLGFTNALTRVQTKGL